MKKSLLLISFCASFLSVEAQTNTRGPGGILNTTGATNLSLWLDANNGPSLSGVTVNSWSDLSGYANTANPPAASNKPQISAAAINGFPVVRFDGSNSYLEINNAASLNTTQWTFFMVGKANTNHDYNYFFGKGNDGTENYEFLSYGAPYVHTPIYFTSTARGFLNTANPTAAVNSYSVWQYDYSTGGGRAIYLNGTLNTSDAENRTPQTNTNKFRISNEEGTTGRFLDGDIAELIMFKTRLNLAQRIIVNNYLAAKYGLALTANDKYTMDNAGNGNYDYNVAGVGQATDGTQVIDSRGTGMLEVYNIGGLANDRFFFWGDDNGNAAADNFSDVPSPVVARFSRVWRVSNSGITTEDIIIDLAGLGSVTPANLRLLIDKDGDGIFSDETAAGGGIKTGFTLLSGTRYLLTNQNILNGERFTIGTTNTSNTPLPVELLSFNAIYSDKKVDLTWATASETNNDYFTIERTKDGSSFETVSTVDGAGNSTSVLEYTERDYSPLEGLSYYRLVQTDFNGDKHFSPLVAVNYSFGEDGISIYPNPASDASEVMLNLNFPENQEVLVVVRDIQGKEFYSKVHITSENNQLVAVDPDHKIAAGVYLIIASSENKIYSKKLIIK